MGTVRRPPAGSVQTLTVVVLVVVALAAAVAAGVWFAQIKKPVDLQQSEQDELFRKLTLGPERVTNALDPAYADGDGDLIADPPKDPARLVDPPTLTFCYVAVEDPGPFEEAFKDLMAHVAQATGKRVEYLEVGSTNEQLRALRDGALHVTGFNTGGVPIAVNACGFVPVSLLAGPDDGGFYKMQVIVRANSLIRALSDLRGHELTLTDASSNSGYKAPLVLLRDAGLVPGRDYGIRYSLSQDASIEGIASGDYEAAAVASDVLTRAVAAGKIKPEQFRVIHESGQFPSAALGYAHNLKPELAAKVREALLKFDWAGTSMSAYFNKAGKTRFVPADYKKDWEAVRRIDDEIGYVHRLAEPTTQPAATRPS